MPDTYPEEAFLFDRNAAQVFVKNGDNIVPLKRSDINPASESASYLSSFGETVVAFNEPYIQSAPVNNHLPSNFRAYTAGGGEGGVQDREFKINTNTSVGGYGAIQSFRSLNYKAGAGGMGRFTARFPNGGVANSWQGVGFINLGDELSFGYNGTDFGVWHRHDGKAEIRKLTLGTGAGGTELATFNINGTAYSTPVTAGTTNKNAYEIATFLDTGASAFTSWQNDNNVYISYASDGLKTGTFSYSSNGNSAGFWTIVASGVTKTSEFIAQTGWNQDVRTGLDPTKGNVYQINYQYLGYGDITFSIENPETAKFEPVHIIKYANAKTSPSLGNPSMHMGLYAVSLGSTENIEIFCASMAGYSQGSIVPTRNPRAFSNVKNVSSTMTNLFSIRNKRSINGVTNQVEIEPVFISAFTESSKGATFTVYGNTTVAGPTNFSDVGTNLVAEYDVTGAAVTEGDGRELLTFVVPQNSAQIIDLTPLRIRVPPTLTLTVAAKVNAGAASDTGASLVWYEDV